MSIKVSKLSLNGGIAHNRDATFTSSNCKILLLTVFLELCKNHKHFIPIYSTTLTGKQHLSIANNYLKTSTEVENIILLNHQIPLTKSKEMYGNQNREVIFQSPTVE